MDQKDKEQMKNWIKLWKYSPKFKQFISQKNKKQMEQNDISKEEMIEHYRSLISEKELTTQCQRLIFNANQQTDEEELYWHFYSICCGKTIEQLRIQLINSLRAMYAYMAIYQENENYELCDLLKTCADIYLIDYQYSLVTFYNFDVEEQLKMEYIDNYYKQLFLLD